MDRLPNPCKPGAHKTIRLNIPTPGLFYIQL